jgi:outer membrane protein assembly factor BamE (lipoprotein component of BamABCDE complex)
VGPAGCEAGRRLAAALALAVLAAVPAACTSPSETFTRGQQITPDQLAQVPIGSSREQVLLALGTPTTTGLADGEVFYYISQTDVRRVAFERPAVKDRRILAVYLNEKREVRDIAEYGLKDGKVFDFLSRKTRTGGSDLAFVSQILTGLLNPSL